MKNVAFLLGKPRLSQWFSRVSLGGLFLLVVALGARAETGAVAAPLSAWDDLAEQAAKDPADRFSHARSALERRSVWQEYYRKFSDWKPSPPSPQPGRLRALTEPPTEPRFVLTGKVWPESPGEASICLWEDDKLAAASVSIDDNNAFDVPAWEEVSEKYGGLKLTWFLVTSNIDGAVLRSRQRQSGTWKLWQELLDKGYRFGSHSVTHAGNPVFEDGWPGPDWECEVSKQHLDEGLNGQRTLIFAKPGTAIPAFRVSEAWRPSFEKYYIAARGGSGIPINRANQTDYFDIGTLANVQTLLTEEPDRDGWYLGDLFNPESAYYRGWVTVFTHSIGQDPDLESSQNPAKAALGKVFRYFQDHADELWIGFLEDVAMYGQVRDTASLTVEPATSERIALTLTSRMDPEIFDYPLTVKVRLFDSWKGVRAVQQGSEIPSKVVVHEGATYALVRVLADRGPVELTPAQL